MAPASSESRQSAIRGARVSKLSKLTKEAGLLIISHVKLMIIYYNDSGTEENNFCHNVIVEKTV